MKYLKGIIAAAAAAALSVSPSAGAYAAVNTDITAGTAVYEQITIPDYNENAPRFANAEEAAAYLKEQMKKHTEFVDFIVEGWSPEKDGGEDERDITDVINDELVAVTDDTTEGFYLFLTASNSPGCIYRTEGAYVFYNFDYHTTAEQEKQVTAEVAKLKDTPEYKAAMKSDIYDKILWAYDTTIANMSPVAGELEDFTYGTAYSALVAKKANETGYLHLIVRLLQEVGVQPMIYMTNLNALTNDSADCHLLCLAEIDGLYYYLDPIWEYQMGENKHRFFLKGYKDLDSDNEGNADFTHVHIYELFNFPLDEIMEETNTSKTKYIRSCDPGDVNNDGEINAVDASMMLKEYAKLSSSEHKGSFSGAQKKAADIDDNGYIDAVDASLTLSYYAYVSTLKSGSTPKSIKEYAAK